jgi:hypothetical protein
MVADERLPPGVLLGVKCDVFSALAMKIIAFGD